MRKRMAALVLCGVLALTGNAQVLAADVTSDDAIEISPRMENINQATAILSVDSAGNATINCKVSGPSGTTTHVTITAKLQRYVDGEWETLKTFTAESNSFWVSLNDSYRVSKGYTYRVRATVRADSDSSMETKTVLSREVKY